MPSSDAREGWGVRGPDGVLRLAEDQYKRPHILRMDLLEADRHVFDDWIGETQAWDEAQGFIKRLGYRLVPVRLVEVEAAMGSSSKIEAAALRWIEARILVDGLRDERNTIECVREPDDPPCWKIVGHRPPDGDPIFEREPGDWCLRCRERQSAHERFVSARPLVGARLAALHRLCKAEYRRLEAEIVPPALPGEIETTGEES